MRAFGRNLGQAPGVLPGDLTQTMATILDWLMMIGAACAGLAVAAICILGLMVWLSGGDSRPDR